MNEAAICPLCQAGQSKQIEFQAPPKSYHSCGQCGLVWLSKKNRLSNQEALAHYSNHTNSPDDHEYRAFLARLWDPLKARLSVGMRGLDYGSGPGPTLFRMAEEDGFPCSNYDPMFHPDSIALDQRYDFVTCTEVAEHFHTPHSDFKRLRELLRPNGWLGIMTSRLTPNIDFETWHYRKDPTHTSFYRDETFEWISGEFGFHPPIIISRSVVLLQICH